MTTAKDLVAAARGRIDNLAPAEVDARLMERDSVLVDVREPQELDEHGLIAGSLHVPRGLLEFWADPRSPSHRPELDPGRSTIVYCAAGSRSALAGETLLRLGYRDVAHLDGGIEAWKQHGRPVVTVDGRQTDHTSP